MIAPVIPGLNDFEIPSILQAAATHGAQGASYVMLRLPWSVKEVFIEWLDRVKPLQKDKVISLIQQVRDGDLNRSEFGKRLNGTGWIADHIRQTFTLFAKKHGLDQKPTNLNTSLFRRPLPTSGQLRLF